MKIDICDICGKLVKEAQYPAINYDGLKKDAANCSNFREESTFYNTANDKVMYIRIYDGLDSVICKECLAALRTTVMERVGLQNHIKT